MTLPDKDRERAFNEEMEHLVTYRLGFMCGRCLDPQPFYGDCERCAEDEIMIQTYPEEE